MNNQMIAIFFVVLSMSCTIYSVETRLQYSQRINTMEAIKAILVVKKGYTAKDRWMLLDGLGYTPQEALQEVLEYGHKKDTAFYKKKFSV